MKKKILLTSLLSIVMCLSLVIGATMALFASRSEEDIAITSGRVDVAAKIVGLTTYSKDVQISEEEVAEGAFENGGKASFDGDTVSLDRVSPGDRVVIRIDIANSSSIPSMQRVTLACRKGEALFGQLLVGIGDNGTDFTYYGSYASAWEDVAASGEGAASTSTVYVAVELPAYATENWQDMECDISLAVEAVQGNASVSEGKSSLVYRVTTQEELEAALAQMQSGETVILDGGAWDGAEIAFSDAKTVYVRGYEVGTLTVNAPNGVIHYYNDTDYIAGEAVAGDSLHVYGTVGSLSLNSGRAVVEAGASIDSVEVVPSGGATAKIEVAAEAEVRNIAVNAPEGATADVAIEEGANVSEITVSGEGNTDFDMNVTTAEALAGALQGSGSVTLGADIATDEKLVVPEGVSVTLDLNGYDIIGTGADVLVENNGTMIIDGDGNSCMYTTDIAAQGRHVFLNNGTLTINGGRFGDKNTDETDANDVNRGNAVRNYGTLTINGGYFTACDNFTPDEENNRGFAYAIANEVGTTTIYDATVYGRMNGVLAADGGTLIVKDGVYTLGNGTSTYRMAYTSDYGVVQIDGGTFTRNVNNTNAFFGAFYAHTEDSVNIIVNGGTFTDLVNGTIRVDGSGNANDEYGGYYGGHTVINGGTFSGDIVGNMVTDNRQTIQAYSEDSFKNALGSVPEGGTILLESDIGLEHTGNHPGGGYDTYITIPNVTIDLQGHTITVVNDGDFGMFSIAALR